MRGTWEGSSLVRKGGLAFRRSTSVVEEAVKCTVGRSWVGLELSPYSPYILQMKKWRLLDCVPSAHGCVEFGLNPKLGCFQSPALYTLPKELALLRWGLWGLAPWVQTRGFSLGRGQTWALARQAWRGQDVLSEGSLKAPFFHSRAALWSAGSYQPNLHTTFPGGH